MDNPIYAMDTYFRSSICRYPFDVRCEITRELGCEGTCLSLLDDRAWEELPLLPEAASRHGLNVTSVYMTFPLAEDDTDPQANRLLEVARTVQGTDTIEVALKTAGDELTRSDPAGDDLAARWLEKLLKIAAPRGITVALYPHLFFWMERVDDALRLLERLAHPHLRLSFAGFHWYAADRKALPERIEAAAPYLHRVNLNGSRPAPAGSKTPASIEPLDSGEMDNFALLALLRRAGFTGPIGLQGFSIGGDVYAQLARSVNALRDMQRRLAESPHWTELQWR